MSGKPKSKDKPCTGNWACDGESHCVCWWASTPTLPCCQCGARDEPASKAGQR